MTKVRNFAEIAPNIGFSEFDFYDLYRSTFEKNQPNQKPNFRAVRQSVRLFFCPLGAVPLPPVRHPCRPRAIPNAGGSYFSTPMDSDEKANHFTRWLPLSIQPEKFGLWFSPSPSCQSFACLPKVRAAPPSARRSPDGAKPRGRASRSGFQPGLKFSLARRKKKCIFAF